MRRGKGFKCMNECCSRVFTSSALLSESVRILRGLSRSHPAQQLRSHHSSSRCPAPACSCSEKLSCMFYTPLTHVPLSCSVPYLPTSRSLQQVTHYTQPTPTSSTWSSKIIVLIIVLPYPNCYFTNKHNNHVINSSQTIAAFHVHVAFTLFPPVFILIPPPRRL